MIEREFYCRDCNRSFSLYFELKSPLENPTCPYCGGTNLVTVPKSKGPDPPRPCPCTPKPGGRGER